MRQVIDKVVFEVCDELSVDASITEGGNYQIGIYDRHGGSMFLCCEEHADPKELRSSLYSRISQELQTPVGER